jgi:hypothetical protein
MKRWKQWIRLAVIGGASFVLLVTVLPQVASGLGFGPLAKRLATSVPCSSGVLVAASSSVCAPVGTVTGKVTITGAPKGFSPGEIGAGACPDTAKTAMACAEPVYDLASDGVYSLSLTAGKWLVDGFYETRAFGGVFLGTAVVVTVKADAKSTKNFTVAYQKPAAVHGTLHVTGVPAGSQLYELSVLLCPSFAPYNGTTASIACVNGYDDGGVVGDAGSYSVTGLPPGKWTAYPGFCTDSGCHTNAKAGKALTLVSGVNSTANLTTPYIVPGYGLVSGTVTVTGAPLGFSDPEGVSLCGKEHGLTECNSASVEGGVYSSLLAVGTWKVTGLYLVPPFYNAVSGATKTISVTSGHSTTLNLTDPYQVLGGAAGLINVVGDPADVPIESYTVLACPAGGGPDSLNCISEYSGPGGNGFEVASSSSLGKIPHPAAARPKLAAPSYNAYQLSTLTKGTWLLYPGYQTVFGSVTDPTASRVTITPGQTITRNLTIPYQFPSDGAVVGSVVMVGAPGNGYDEAGAEACSAKPTKTTCDNEQQAYSSTDGQYQLLLSPGTWWVAGFVDEFGEVPSLNQSISPPVKITVKAGVENTEDFVVDAS